MRLEQLDSLFTAEAVGAWKAEPRAGRGGEPRYSSLAIETALTLRAVFRLALRQIEGLIGSILQLLGPELAVLDHSTLSRRAATLEVPRPRCRGEPMHLLVDSIGLRLCGAGEWLMGKRHRAWKMRHLTTDADTDHIVASVLTGKDADDGSQVDPLLGRAKVSVAPFTGDGACDRDDICAEVAARHPDAAVIVPPRSSAVPSDIAEQHQGVATAEPVEDPRQLRPGPAAAGDLSSKISVQPAARSARSCGSRL